MTDLIPDDPSVLKEWLAALAPESRALAAEFSPTHFEVFGFNGRMLFLLGYDGASDALIVSPIDPRKHPNDAGAARMALAADELRIAICDPLGSFFTGSYLDDLARQRLRERKRNA